MPGDGQILAWRLIALATLPPRRRLHIALPARAPHQLRIFVTIVAAAPHGSATLRQSVIAAIRQAASGAPSSGLQAIGTRIGAAGLHTQGQHGRYNTETSQNTNHVSLLTLSCVSPNGDHRPPVRSFLITGSCSSELPAPSISPLARTPGLLFRATIVRVLLATAAVTARA